MYFDYSRDILYSVAVNKSVAESMLISNCLKDWKCDKVCGENEWDFYPLIL